MDTLNNSFYTNLTPTQQEKFKQVHQLQLLDSLKQHWTGIIKVNVHQLFIDVGIVSLDCTVTVYSNDYKSESRQTLYTPLNVNFTNSLLLEDNITLTK